MGSKFALHSHDQASLMQRQCGIFRHQYTAEAPARLSLWCLSTRTYDHLYQTVQENVAIVLQVSGRDKHVTHARPKTPVQSLHIFIDGFEQTSDGFNYWCAQGQAFGAPLQIDQSRLTGSFF